MSYRLFELGKCFNCNVILISMDALRADHMSLYGYSKQTTPNIDKWSKNSAVYTNVYAEIPMTYPSFVSFMTGRDSVQTNIFRNRITTDRANKPFSYEADINSSYKTLAQLLKERGYITSAYVSSAALSSKISSINKGFDNYENVFKEPTDSSGQRYEENMVKKPIEFITKNKNKKFFLWLHYIDPHAPYNPIEKYRCKFNPKYCNTIQIKDYPLLDKERQENDSCQKTPLSEDKVESRKMLYDGEIGYTDDLIKKVFEAIKQQGLDKNTVVVFYSDHGESFEHSFYFDHSEVIYNGTTKIPFIIHNPKSSKKSSDNSLLQNSDLIHILLSNIGIPTKLEKRQYVYGINFDKTNFSVSNGTYKYILNYPYSCNHNKIDEELFNIKNDPGETKNLMGKYNKLSDSLRKELFKHFPIEKYKFEPQTSPATPPPDLLEQVKYLGY